LSGFEQENGMTRLYLHHTLSFRMRACALVLPLALAAYAHAQTPQDKGTSSAQTAPSAGGTLSSGGRTNALGDPKGNQHGTMSGTGQMQKLQVGKADSKLMRQMAQAHLAEIKTAALATAISDDKALRGYAEKMLEEHGKALDELRLLARRADVILPGGVETEQASLLHKLALATGKQFNQMYHAEAGLALHQQSQALFKEAASRAEAPELKAYANNVLPIVGKHLQLAQQMADDPASAAAAVQSSMTAGQSTSVQAPPGSASQQTDNNSGNKGNADISSTAGGQKK
jgi:putative membrane protein